MYIYIYISQICLYISQLCLYISPLFNMALHIFFVLNTYSLIYIFVHFIYWTGSSKCIHIYIYIYIYIYIKKRKKKYIYICISDVRGPFRTKNPRYEICSHFWENVRFWGVEKYL